MSTLAQINAVRIPTKRRRSYGGLLLILAEVAAVECALWFACVLRLAIDHWSGHYAIGPAQYRFLSLGILTLPLANFWVGLYPGYGSGAVQRFRDRVYATILVFSILLTWDYVYQRGEWSRAVLISALLFSLILMPAFESFARKILTRAGLCGVRIIVIGAGRTGCAVIEKLNSEPSLGFIPVAILDDDSSKWGGSIGGVPVCGPVASADKYLDCADCVIVAIPGVPRDRTLAIVQELQFSSIIIVPDLAGVQTLWTVSRDLGGILGIELRKNLLLRKNRVMKRCLDYAIAVPAFLLTLPTVAVCALLVKLTSPGPVFYRQEREGAGGRPIQVWKLRTMHVDGDRILRDYLDTHPEQREYWLRFFKLKKDPRVIPGIGTFLRASSIDELPQLWNVLAGEMSLVGPRPFPHYHLSSFPEKFRNLRCSVAPGLTGLWQVSGRSDGDLRVQETLDTYYIRNWSVWLDIYILARTVGTILAPKGAY